MNELDPIGSRIDIYCDGEHILGASTEKKQGITTQDDILAVLKELISTIEAPTVPDDGKL
jgi:hypothetical protein